jgi:hypothetical protein
MLNSKMSNQYVKMNEIAVGALLALPTSLAPRISFNCIRKASGDEEVKASKIKSSIKHHYD